MEPNQNPNQPLAQPVQPSATPAQPAAPQTMEQQMEAVLNEVAQPVEQPMASKEPKKSNGMLIGLILAVVVALCGVGFGVFMMMQKNDDEATYKSKISSLTTANSTLQAQVNEMATTLNGDEALALLNAAATKQGLGYKIGYANVYAKYNGDDAIAYWVKYMPIDVAEGAETANNIIFTLDDEGEWEFVLPGFNDGVLDTTQYTVIELVKVDDTEDEEAEEDEEEAEEEAEEEEEEEETEEAEADAE